jgi:hypothetical protein
MDATELPLLAPAEGAEIGARQSENSPWLPFRVEMVTPKYVVCRSPLQPGTRFSFRRGETGWQWQPWAACPALLVPCKKCRGHGEIENKKAEMMQTCPTCHGEGKVPRHDPFAS